MDKQGPEDRAVGGHELELREVAGLASCVPPLEAAHPSVWLQGGFPGWEEAVMGMPDPEPSFVSALGDVSSFLCSSGHLPESHLSEVGVS